MKQHVGEGDHSNAPHSLSGKESADPNEEERNKEAACDESYPRSERNQVVVKRKLDCHFTRSHWGTDKVTVVKHFYAIITREMIDRKCRGQRKYG